MSNTKISELPSLAVPAPTDIVPLVDDPAGSPVTKQATVRALVDAGRAGAILTDAEGSTSNISVGSSYVLITTWDASASVGDVTPDHTTNNDVTVATAGYYAMDFTISYSGTASKTFTCTLHVNGSPNTAASFARKLGTGGDVGAGGFCALVSLAASDVLTVYVKSDTAGNTFTVHSGQFRVNSV